MYRISSTTLRSTQGSAYLRGLVGIEWLASLTVTANRPRSGCAYRYQSNGHVLAKVSIRPDARRGSGLKPQELRPDLRVRSSCYCARA